MWYLYHMAGIRVLCAAPFPVMVGPESRAFITALDPALPLPPADLTLTLEPAEALDDRWKSGIRAADRYYLAAAEGLRVYYCLAGREPHACACWTGPDRIVCRYLRGREKDVNRSRNIVEFLSPETLLPAFGGLLLHAAFIRWQGRGILFTAPSGTGKSTQARLWQEHLGADVLNGDRAGLRDMDGSWTGWGLPCAGSSGIYRNESGPLGAIVTLSQGQENEIRRLSASAAFVRLLPELNLRRWDGAAMGRGMDLLTDLLARVPVYHLSCRPDREAVLLLRDTLMKENV